MKKISKTYAIVKPIADSDESYFEGTLSFNKAELKKKCKELNKPFEEKGCIFSVYVVLPLEDAITNFKDAVADYYMEQTDDY